MKTTAPPSTNQATRHRRSFILALGSTAFGLSACYSPRRAAALELTPEERLLQHKFRGIRGVVTRFDAANFKEYVTITTDRGASINGSGTLSPSNVSNSSYGGGFPIPVTIRAIWRRSSGDDMRSSQGVWSGGTIIGDYTVPVAERIPDEVLDYIRQNGGALRLKIRLHDGGVFIGWDVEMRLPIPNLPRAYTGPENYLEYRMPGGDFREAQIYNGKIVNHAWYIDKQGNKVFTDENPYARNYDPTRPIQIVNGVHE